MPNPQRPRVPEYPRPVPYVSADEAPICHDTIIYEQWTDEAEEEAGKRAAKRRRVIQETAGCYLRQESVFILCASLKGPFDEGWKNPWAKKRQWKDAEIPETTAKETLWRTSLMAAAAQADKSIVIDPTPLHHQPTTRPDDEKSNVFNARSHNVQPENRPLQRSAKKVEDWLRKTAPPAAKQQIHVHSSPTPAVKQYFKEPTPAGYDNPFFARDDDDAPAGSVQRAENSMKEHIESALPDASQNTEQSHESPRRAELAILAHKRLSVHRVPPSTHLPEFEYRRPRSRGQKLPQADTRRREGSAPALIPGQQALAIKNKQHTGPDAVKLAEKSKRTTSDEKSTSRLALSAETSKASTIQQNLPSAQIMPAPSLAAMPSNAQSTEELLQSVPPVSSKETVADLDLPKRHGVTQDAEKENQPARGTSVEADAEVVEAPGASLEQTPVREFETQEMIAAIRPFDFSTVKKPLKPAAEYGTPATVTKATKAKQKKKASFALRSPSSEGSQTSIKASMKITKAPSRPVLGKSSPRRRAFTSLDSRVETSLDESLPSVSAMFGTKMPEAPKGVLKSTGVNSTGPVRTGTTNTTSTSAKQDAQVVPEPPEPALVAGGAVDEDENFDLDGAMDELGSYLGTWDAEVEANKLTS